MVTLMLVAVWLPASSHALLESAGLIHQHPESHAHDDQHADSSPADSHDHDVDNHAAADGQCLIPSAKVQFSKPDVLAFGIQFIFVLAAVVRQLPDEAVFFGLSPPGAAPPEFSHRWQFASRAALPVRAPSFIS